MPDAVIVSAARSPIGRAVKGSLAEMRPDDLLAGMIEATLTQLPGFDARELDDILVGCGQPAGESGFNIARAVAVRLGLDSVPGTTVNRYCSSSLQTTRMAFHAIRSGEGEAFISGGVETVSRYRLGSADGWPNTRNPLFDAAAERTQDGLRDDSKEWVDPRSMGLLPDVYIEMGATAENVARLCDISREEMDAFALLSQHRAEKAIADGFWKRDITPVTLPDGSVVDADDGPRAGVTAAALAGLTPAFREDGRVTAGNCCPLNDGAAALVIMSDTKARQLGLQPLARIVATGVSALSPEIMGLGPVEASRQALLRAGLGIDDIDLVEINEAFAAQVIPSQRQLGIDPERLNVFGGAIAVGHPFGMTGARLTTTLIHGLREKDKQFGLETMCVAGGQGMAMIIERLT
ncbi:acetyl-CoA C-acetyltransferase [Homoserinimonas aerilata]|nr:acetyl-CoA C-acetyltransferase [Homoserinimonas aerilata]